jgi:hypothetical protein
MMSFIKQGAYKINPQGLFSEVEMMKGLFFYTFDKRRLSADFTTDFHYASNYFYGDLF